MRKRSLVLLIILVAGVLLGITGCAESSMSESEDIYVSIRKSVNGGVVYLKWVVENRSKTESVTFKAGDILNYEIRHHNSGKMYSSMDKDYTDVTLKPGDLYETTVEFKDLPVGRYDASFWALWGGDRENKMVMSFDI